MAAQLQKTFQCMNCNADIKLQRKDDDSGWLRFELDGHTPHKCAAVAAPDKAGTSTTTTTIPKRQQQSVIDLEHKIDNLSNQVTILSERVKQLVKLLEARNEND
jgi:hypothetical protein